MTGIFILISTATEGIIQSLRYGLSEIIVTDNTAYFMLDAFENFCKGN